MTCENSSAPVSPSPDLDAELTEKQKADLEDPEVQARNRREMLRQLRLRQCPGCGEDEIF